MLIEQFQAYRMACAKLLFLFRDPRLLHAGFVLRPFFRKVQITINNSVTFAADVTQINAHLTVINLAQPTAPLTRNADRLLSRFRKRRGIKSQNAILFAQLSCDLTSQCFLKR